jgi:hypothetical protein
MNNAHIVNDSNRPWWFVRTGLLATLAALVGVLVTLLSRPEVLRLAGL